MTYISNDILIGFLKKYNVHKLVLSSGSFDCCASPIPKKAAFLSSTTEKHSNHLSTSTEN